RDVNKMALWIFFASLLSSCLAETIEYFEDDKRPCTYFESSRYASPESGLVNCSWYSEKACCKRTEVTSVFGGMLPLHDATVDCRNKINYMMCYFCSPEQHRWYDKKAYLCSSYCTDLFESCRTADYKGKKIGEAYSNGEAFCEGQNFAIADGSRPCFDFDENVFGTAIELTHNPIAILISTLTLLIITSWIQS
ncbi:unnamed protein product, partial [Owenia fusiformis]